MQALSRRMNSAPLEIRFERAMEAEQAQKAMAALEEALGAAPVKLDAACWQVDAQREAADDARALSALVGLGAPVCAFARRQASLEKVFMEVTQAYDAQSNP